MALGSVSAWPVLGIRATVLFSLFVAVAGVVVLVFHRPLIAFSKAKARMPAPDSAHTFGVIGIGLMLLVIAATTAFVG